MPIYFTGILQVHSIVELVEWSQQPRTEVTVVMMSPLPSMLSECRVESAKLCL